ncbi:deoxyguanosinetriphosphate triphosphohydrolase [Flaviflexus equikiangi]|uniref:Deoxyguanosinetriphosphate triphosphohydrolase n=1 Tax=Flaviflexus equikiangi TaxID=2758573 RepID=A0ABS2TEU9_9ACTO|nr:deoxyguanosinetriphosphate triphosphohydrolase [Flaviflexus equikiangi]MBM9433179.1 deoxyguanosinetriphosphate triphosphohydrolase [Flaviflexus equikiangi]
MEYGSIDVERWAPEGAHSQARGPFERDRARVLHSSGLRRLGAKTQVLGPASNDFIRTRLTHTLEVAQIGRSLAKYMGADQDLVETACLCHDLGHPPFGHNGERALAEVSTAIGGFEGNAQTLRLITRLEPKRFFPDDRPAGMNLTRATVDATIKYPWGAGEGRRKFNVYEDDRDVFEWARLGNEGQCVEAQMMDLADDIGYSVHDVEDAVVRGHFSLESLRADSDRIVSATVGWYGGDSGRLSAAFERLFPLFPPTYSGSQRDLARLKDLTSTFIGRFLTAVTDASPQSARYTGGVIVPDDIADEILLLKGIAVTYVMAPRELEPTYLSQRSVLFDLVDALWDRPSEMEEMYLESYRRSGDDASKLRSIIDQVAALTDQSAMAWHARLCGMLRSPL